MGRILRGRDLGGKKSIPDKIIKETKMEGREVRGSGAGVLGMKGKIEKVG